MVELDEIENTEHTCEVCEGEPQDCAHDWEETGGYTWKGEVMVPNYRCKKCGAYSQ